MFITCLTRLNPRHPNNGPSPKVTAAAKSKGLLLLHLKPLLPSPALVPNRPVYFAAKTMLPLGVLPIVASQKGNNDLESYEGAPDASIRNIAQSIATS